MTCPPQRAWIRWQGRIKTTVSAIVSFLLKWDLSIVQSHIPILFKSAQVKCVFLQKLWQPSFEMVWSQSGHWWYRWLVEKWRQGSTEEDWPGQISQMERDVISKTEIILPLKSSNVSRVYSIQLNQHQALSTYKVYCTIWIWLLFCETFAETSSSSWRAREPRVAGGSSQFPQPPTCS